MLPWKSHESLYVPGFTGARSIPVLPPCTTTLEPPATVTVCASPSLFTTLTWAPGLTEAGTA